MLCFWLSAECYAVLATEDWGLLPLHEFFYMRYEFRIRAGT